MSDKIVIKEILDLALKSHTENKLENAKKNYKKILEIDPEHFETNYLLGTLYLQDKKFNEAKINFNKAIKIKSNHAGLCNNYGATLIELGEYDEAINYFQKAIQIQPDYSHAYNNLGSVLKELEHHEKAINYFQRAIQIQPDLIDARLNLGITFKELGNFKKATEYFQHVIKIQPSNVKAHQNLIESYERANKEKDLEEAISNAKNFVKEKNIIKLYEAVILYNKDKFSEAINFLESISFDKNDIKNEIRRVDTLARCYDRINDNDNAFRYFEIANSLSPNLMKINRFNKNRYLERIKVRADFFSRPEIKKWKNLKSSKVKLNPIFLIGFPRSGTTLLDTILRSHPKIEVIEEKPMVEELINSLKELPQGGLKDLENITDIQLEKMRKVYMDSLKSNIQNGNNSKIYIDKHPLNMIYAGEIFKIFPNSKFIFSLRHPCDCVLSCFMQNFVMNDAMANFLNLNDAAHLYDVVMKLWSQYISIFKITHHEVKYENLVESFEPTVKSVLSFLELPWDNSLLKYTITAKKRENIATASYSQVTKPIYSHADGRWKKYEKQMSNIYPILEPWIKKFKY